MRAIIAVVVMAVAAQALWANLEQPAGYTYEQYVVDFGKDANAADYAERKALFEQEQMEYQQKQARAQPDRKAIVSRLKEGQYVYDKRDRPHKLGKVCRIQLNYVITVVLMYEDIPAQPNTMNRITRIKKTSDSIDVLHLVEELTEAQRTWIKEHEEKMAKWEASQKAKYLSLIGTLEVGQTKHLIEEPSHKLSFQRKSPAEISHQVAHKTGYWQHHSPYSATYYGSWCPLCNSEMTTTYCDNGGDLGRQETADHMVCTAPNCGCVRLFDYDGRDGALDM